jgi:hypothetical protein
MRDPPFHTTRSQQVRTAAGPGACAIAAMCSPRRGFGRHERQTTNVDDALALGNPLIFVNWPCHRRERQRSACTTRPDRYARLRLKAEGLIFCASGIWLALAWTQREVRKPSASTIMRAFLSTFGLTLVTPAGAPYMAGLFIVFNVPISYNSPQGLAVPGYRRVRWGHGGATRPTCSWVRRASRDVWHRGVRHRIEHARCRAAPTVANREQRASRIILAGLFVSRIPLVGHGGDPHWRRVQCRRHREFMETPRRARVAGSPRQPLLIGRNAVLMPVLDN